MTRQRRPSRRGSPPGAALTRRGFLAGALGTAGGLGLTGCGTGLAAGITGGEIAPSTVEYWDLFGGGDGVRMQQMLQGFRSQYPSIGLQAVTLAWGNPYYTKLSLATLGGKPPDVAVSHQSRIPTLASAGLLQELTPADLARHGMSGDKFNAQAWKGSQVGGKAYAVPLDTHPFVLFYNTDICAKAGLLDGGGNLRPLDGPDALVTAMTKAKAVTGAWGGVCSINNDTATNWRFFQSLYAQLGGQVLADNGKRVVLDDALATQVLKYLRRLSVELKLMPSDVDYQGAIALFASGKAGFYLQGEWEITTFQTAKTPFSMTLFPNIFGGTYKVQADRHTLIVPRRDPLNRARTDKSLTLIRSLLDQSLIWSKGGHVPSWLPVRDSTEYAQLRPQSNYAAAADSAVLDPPAWYSGSGSNFENVVGSAIATVRAGQADPAAALRQMRSQLQTLASTPSPV